MSILSSILPGSLFITTDNFYRQTSCTLMLVHWLANKVYLLALCDPQELVKFSLLSCFISFLVFCRFQVLHGLFGIRTWHRRFSMRKYQILSSKMAPNKPCNQFKPQTAHWNMRLKATNNIQIELQGDKTAEQKKNEPQKIKRTKQCCKHTKLGWTLLAWCYHTLPLSTLLDTQKTSCK